MKSTWRLLNEVINKRKSRNSVQSSFIIDNKEITDPMEIANHFCEFFTSIGPNLAKMIPSSTSSFRSFLSGSFINSIFLEPTTELEILKFVQVSAQGLRQALIRLKWMLLNKQLI